MSPIEEQIRDHIVAEIMMGTDTVGLTNETRLVDEEIIDSLGIFMLVNFIQDHFGVEVGPEEVTLENFETISAIGQLVAGKSVVR